jgi:hypothetical protein
MEVSLILTNKYNIFNLKKTDQVTTVANLALKIHLFAQTQRVD